jgi:hypothetical protein
MDCSELRHNQRGLSNPFDLVRLFETYSQIRAHINHLVRFVPSSPIKDPMEEPGLCSRCKGVDAEDLPVACAVLKGGPCSACGERADIRSQIKRLEEEIIKLKEKHHALRTTMNAIHDPFIHKLPPEIGSQIFCLCMPTLYLTDGGSSQALRLGAVCRKWRELAWATPNLWETLLIMAIPSTLRTLARSLPGLISEWLDRSGALPLTIWFFQEKISDNDSEKEEFNDAINRIIEVLNLHSGRWRNLHLDIFPGSDILEHLSGSMHPTQLFHLDLAVSGRRSPTQKFMKSKPFPTHLTLSNFSLVSVNIGWDNITNVILSHMSTSECVEILRRAPAVEYFMARQFIRRPDDPPVNANAFTIHPRIRSLFLSEKPAKFMDMITTPALEEWTHFPNGRLPVDAMVSLIKRSGCYLKKLNLHYISVRSEHLSILFQAMPSLERLQIIFESSPNVNDVVNDILVRIFRSPPDQSAIPVDASHDTLLPRLQFLECITQISWDRVPQLYRQGNRQSLTLKSPTNRTWTSDETAMELLKLVDEGAKFQIRDTIEGGDFLENFRKRITGKEGSFL